MARPPALLLTVSIGRTALPGIAALLVANFMLRNLDPLHEMDWALYNYHFVTVLLAPLVAALGAWEGVRTASAIPVLASRGRVSLAQSATVVSMLLWVGGAYLLGALGVIIASSAFGTPGLPSAVAVASSIPALCLLGASAALGFGVGTRARRLYTVGLVGVVVFIAIISGYSVRQSFVRVGGATASLVGLSPRFDVIVAQSVLFVGLGVLAMLAAAGRSTASRRRALLVAVAAISIIGAGMVLAPLSSPLRSVPVDVQCQGSTVRVCLTSEYERFRETVVAEVNPFIASLIKAGAIQSAELTMDPTRTGDGVGLIPAIRAIRRAPGDVAIGSATNIVLGSCPDPLATHPDETVAIAAWVDESYREMAAGMTVVLPERVARAIASVGECSP